MVTPMEVNENFAVIRERERLILKTEKKIDSHLLKGELDIVSLSDQEKEIFEKYLEDKYCDAGWEIKLEGNFICFS